MLKMIIFDKDGTLIDSSELWQQPSIDVAYELFKQTELSDDEIQQEIIKLGIRDNRTLTPDSLFFVGSIEEQAAYFRSFLPHKTSEQLAHEIEQSYYDAIKASDLSEIVVPGVREMLAELREAGYLIGMITNDNKSITDLTLEKIDLVDAFDFVGCADEYGPKPNPEALFEIARQFHLSLNDLVYVGDAEHDITYGQHTRGAIGVALTDDVLPQIQAADIIVQNFDNFMDAVKHVERKKQ